MDVDANFCVGSVGSGGSDIRRQRRRRRRRRRRPSMPCSSETTTDGSSFLFSDTDSDDNRTRQSSAASASAATADGRPEKCRISKRAKVVRRHKFNCPVNSDSEEIDLESGELELKMRNNLEEKRVIRCRICHLNSEENVNCDSGRGDEEFNGILIELGCDCKGDLGAVHKICAETWFKIKGDTICEICGATALNIVAEQAINVNLATNTASSEMPVFVIETESFWRGRRLLNVLLACMVLAFVISWLFHFKVLP